MTIHWTSALFIGPLPGDTAAGSGYMAGQKPGGILVNTKKWKK